MPHGAKVPSVPVELIALPPVAFAMWLLVDATGLLDRWTLRERIGMALAAAMVAGPLSLSLLGLFACLLLLAALTAGLTAFAILRRSGRRPRRPGGAGRWALLRP